MHVLHALASTGWHLLVSSDLSKKTMDKDSLFFRSGPPVQRYFFSVSFNESDKIRLIDSPNQEVTAAFLQCVQVGPPFPPHFYPSHLHSSLALVVWLRGSLTGRSASRTSRRKRPTARR